MTYQPDLERWCNRHKSKIIQHTYDEMLADTYSLTDEKAKDIQSRVVKRAKRIMGDKS